MRLLIDTQALLWYEASDPKLPLKVKELIDDPENSCFVSIASLWEIAVKITINKLAINSGFDSLAQYLVNNGFSILSITVDHLKTLLTLERHHGDPFDRLLIAQAISENLSVVSIDRHFTSYPVAIIW